MADVFPRRNLPDDASQWGRAVEKRTEDTEAGVVAVRQSLQSLNRNTASSLETLANQIQEIEAAQDELEAQQALIQAQQASIIATQTFLATQTVFDSRSSETTYTGNPGGVAWLPFDGTYDCSLVVTTGGAGRLLIQANSNILVGAMTALLGIEVVGVAGPSVPGPYSTYVSSNTGAGAGVSRSMVVGLSSNTTYTVRTRRGLSSTSSGSAVWSSQSLVVTRS